MLRRENEQKYVTSNYIQSCSLKGGSFNIIFKECTKFIFIHGNYLDLLFREFISVYFTAQTTALIKINSRLEGWGGIWGGGGRIYENGEKRGDAHICTSPNFDMALMDP